MRAPAAQRAQTHLSTVLLINKTTTAEGMNTNQLTIFKRSTMLKPDRICHLRSCTDSTHNFKKVRKHKNLEI